MTVETIPAGASPGASDDRPLQAGAGAGASPLPGGVFKIAVLLALWFGSMAIVPPVLESLVRERFALTNEGTSNFMTVHSLPQVLLLGLLVGLFSDRIGRRVPLILLGLMGTGLTTILTPLILDYNVLLGVRFFDGLFGILAFGLLMTRVVDLTDTTNRGRAMGVVMSASPAGYLMGTALAGLFGEERLVALFGVCGGAVMVSALALLPDLRRPEHIERRAPGLRELGRSLGEVPRLWLPVVFGFIDKMSFAALAILTSLALRDEFSLSSGQTVTYAAIALILLQGFFLLASVPSGWIVQRTGPLPVVVVGSAAYGLCLMGMLAFDNLWVFLGLMALAGAFAAFQFVPNMVLVGNTCSPSRRATCMGVFNMSGSYGMITGFVLFGILSEKSYLLSYLVAGGLEVLAATAIGLGALGMVLMRERKK